MPRLPTPPVALLCAADAGAPQLEAADTLEALAAARAGDADGGSLLGGDGGGLLGAGRVGAATTGTEAVVVADGAAVEAVVGSRGSEASRRAAPWSEGCFAGVKKGQQQTRLST